MELNVLRNPAFHVVCTEKRHAHSVLWKPSVQRDPLAESLKRRNSWGCNWAAKNCMRGRDIREAPISAQHCGRKERRHIAQATTADSITPLTSPISHKMITSVWRINKCPRRPGTLSWPLWQASLQSVCISSGLRVCLPYQGVNQLVFLFLDGTVRRDVKNINERKKSGDIFDGRMEAVSEADRERQMIMAHSCKPHERRQAQAGGKMMLEKWKQEKKPDKKRVKRSGVTVKDESRSSQCAWSAGSPQLLDSSSSLPPSSLPPFSLSLSLLFA